MYSCVISYLRCGCGALKVPERGLCKHFEVRTIQKPWITQSNIPRLQNSGTLNAVILTTNFFPCKSFQSSWNDSTKWENQSWLKAKSRVLYVYLYGELACQIFWKMAFWWNTLNTIDIHITLLCLTDDLSKGFYFMSNILTEKFWFSKSF